jgi:hypothetical protein
MTCFTPSNSAALAASRAHRVEVADREHRRVRRVELADQGHVAEHARVAGDVDLEPVLERDNESGGSPM